MLLAALAFEAPSAHAAAIVMIRIVAPTEIRAMLSLLLDVRTSENRPTPNVNYADSGRMVSSA
jgi:hypothetical protein